MAIANVIGDVVTFPGHDFYDNGEDFFIREDAMDLDTFHVFKVIGKSSAKIVYSGSLFDCEKELEYQMRELDEALKQWCDMAAVRQV